MRAGGRASLSNDLYLGRSDERGGLSLDDIPAEELGTKGARAAGPFI